MPKTFVEMQTMTYNPPTAQVTAQKDVTHGSVQPTTKSDKKKMNTSNKKTEVIINPSKKDIQEKKIGSFSDFVKLGESDHWHPDPEKDRKLSNRGAKLRSREDKVSTPKSSSSRELRPGESYMDFAKRHGYKSPVKKKSNLVGRVLKKVGLSNSYESEGNIIDEAQVQPPKEKLKTDRNMFSIPADEREAAKQRLLAKAKAKREAMQKEETEKDPFGRPGGKYGGVKKGGGYEKGYLAMQKKLKELEKKEEVEIEEGMTMKDFKKNRSRQNQKDKRESEKTSPLRRAGIHDDKASPERAARHRANVDPDYDRDDEENMYPGGKLKNPKKIRKAKATGEVTEMLSFSQFMEARRMDKEGVDRGDTRRADRAEKAKASLAAIKKGAERQAKYAKKYGTPATGETIEKRTHKRDFAGSRQAPKVKGQKETPLETQNRRVNAFNKRRMTHGPTTKEKKASAGYDKYERDYKKSYGQNKSAWD
jgi:hypothetical protein